MKKVVKIIFLCMIFGLFLSKASALSLAKNTITMEKGSNQSIELFASSEEKITRVEFTLVYSTYDIPANFIVNSNYTDSNPNGITHKVNLGEGKSGKISLGNVYISVKANANDKSGTININNAKGYTANGDVVKLNAQNINVTVGTVKKDTEEVKEEEKEEKKEEKEETKVVDKNLLDKIESKIVNIELKKDVFEYTVVIEKDVKELDLKAIPKDKDTKIEISSQKIDEIKDNKIIITASNDQIKQDYVIKLSVKNDIEVTIDNEKFEANNSYKGKWILVSIVLIIMLFGGLFLTRKK